MNDQKNIPDANKVTNICLQTFETIAKTGKPIANKEWTVLTCIIQYDHRTENIEVVSLGTGKQLTKNSFDKIIFELIAGTKCISKSEMNNRGDILNDSHAEIMCRRGFIRYLYEQINMSISENPSIFKFDESEKKFKLSNDKISFHLFTTHSPCGDASIYNKDEQPPAKIPKLQPEVLANANESFGQCISFSQSSNANFTGAKIIYDGFNVAHDLMIQSSGNIRTKPGRGDPTLSISCSDKLAKWNVLGMQGALLHQFLTEPIYYDSVTFCDSNFCDIEATERALFKRFTNKLNLSEYKMKIMHPKIQISSGTKFEFEKNDQLDPSPGSIVWCKVKRCPQQVAVSGKRQGVTKKMATTSKGRLSITKIELFREYLDLLKKINQKMNLFSLNTNFDDLAYLDAKNKAIHYKTIWNELKKSYFKIWTVKSDELNTFKID